MVRLGDGSSLQLPHGWTGADGGPCTALIGHSLLCLGGLRKLLNLVKALREPTVPEVVLNGEKIRPLQGSVGAEQSWLDLFEEDRERPWEGFPEAARADQPKKLERLCRYISRPAVSKKRLSLTAHGNVRYQLKRPYRDGTTHVIFGPLDFSKRRASMRRAQRLKRVLHRHRDLPGLWWGSADHRLHRGVRGHREDPHPPRQARCLGGNCPVAALPGTATGASVRLNQAPRATPPQAATPSVAVAVALGPKPGIVKKLAELHDFYPPARAILADTVPKRGLATVG